MNNLFLFEALESRSLLAWDTFNFASDPLFYIGGEGEVVAEAGKSPVMYQINELIVQRDGKLLGVGDSFGGGGVMRLMPDGRPDRTYGGGGQVSFVGHALEAALRPDGKVVVAGWSGIVQLEEDGTPDFGFGDRGWVWTQEMLLDGGTIGFTSVKLQPDGKVLLGGIVNYEKDRHHFLLARLNADGSFDKTFGDGGFVVTPQAGTTAFILDLAVWPDGRIVAAGASGPNKLNDWAVVRYLPDGALDHSFGNGGGVALDAYSADSLLLQPDGSILAVTNNDAGPVVRITRDGAVDPAFGDAVRRLVPAYWSPLKVARGQGDTVVMAWPVQMRVSVHHANGELVKSFGDGGWVTLVPGGYEIPALATHPDGRVTVAYRLGMNADCVEYCAHTTNVRFVRLNGDGSPDADFGDFGRERITMPLELWPSMDDEDIADVLALAGRGSGVDARDEEEDPAHRRRATRGEGSDDDDEQDGVDEDATDHDEGWWDEEDLPPEAEEDDDELDDVLARDEEEVY